MYSTFFIFMAYGPMAYVDDDDEDGGLYFILLSKISVVEFCIVRYY